MKETILIDVIMPAYNSEKYISKAIESIINQTYSNWNLFISDDGSTDNTKMIIDSYSDPRIKRFHNNKNFGTAFTWNKLVEKGNGELITGQDSDDYSFPNRFEVLTQTFIENYDLVMCGSNYSRCYPKWKRIYVSKFPNKYEEILSFIEINKILPILGSARMFKREILHDIENYRMFFNRIGWEDSDFNLRVIEKYKTINIADCLYMYRYVRDSYSRNNYEYNYLKTYNFRIGFFLHDQRKVNNGIDGLMPEGNIEALNDFLQNLKNEFDKDKSFVLRKSCTNRISNYDYIAALNDSFSAIIENPLTLKNLFLLLKILLSFVHNLYRLIFNKKIPQYISIN